MSMASMARSRRPMTCDVSSEESSLACLAHGNLRRFAFDGGVAFAAHGEGRVEHDGVTGDHAVEEVPQR